MQRLLGLLLVMGIVGCGDGEQVALEKLRSLGVRIEAGFGGSAVYFNHSPNANKITDDDLLPLLKLRRVEKVSLAHTSITDAGLVQLQGLSNLQEVVLVSTHVTDAGVAALQQFLPNCKITK